MLLSLSIALDASRFAGILTNISTALLGLRALGTHVGAVYLRDSPPPPQRDDDKLPKYYPPWGQLDDDECEEIEFYDG